jgi:hypothetical protein
MVIGFGAGVASPAFSIERFGFERIGGDSGFSGATTGGNGLGALIPRLSPNRRNCFSHSGVQPFGVRDATEVITS